MPCIRSPLDEKESIFTETVKADKLKVQSNFMKNLAESQNCLGSITCKKGFCNFLIDDKGVIIAANVAPEDLTKVLKKG